MKPFLSRFCLPALTFGLFLASIPCARALTLEELAGTYQGSGTLTLADGRVIPVSFVSTYKPSGKVKSVTTVNGQRIVGHGRVNLITDHIFTGVADGGTTTGFIEFNGNQLRTVTLTRLDADGSVVIGRAEATRAQ